MRPQLTLRILAIVTLIVATPILIWKLLWLPITVQIFVETVSESTANGTADYIKEHTERIWRLAVALALYAVGLCATISLAGVVIGICRYPKVQAITWLCSLLVGIGLLLFDTSSIGPTTDRDYIFLAIYLPIGVTVLSAVALAVQSVFWLRHKA